MIEALIFDVDGTLAETEELHRRAFNETFAEAGLDWHWDRREYRQLLKTTGGKERIARYSRARGMDPEVPAAALHAAKTARYAALVAKGALTPRPGVAALIGEARAAGLRLAIATTTNLSNVETLAPVLFGAPAVEIFEVIVAGDMVPAKKPAPDVYLMALDRLGLPPHRALALEDSRNGLLAAKSARLACCITPSDYTGHEDFSEADLVIPDLAGLGGLAGLLALQRQMA